jgi:hypothetical protein
MMSREHRVMHAAIAKEVELIFHEDFFFIALISVIIVVPFLFLFF